MKLKLGFSTCPNDTFIFDALYHKKINWQGLDFEFILADVEELNQMALNNSIDVTKLSYHAFAHVAQNYLLLDTGSALGFNNGPLLVCKKENHYSPNDIEHLRIAIPGKLTTANLLLKTFFPNIQEPATMLFSDIEQAVLDEKIDAGLLIHENRFTYAQRGLSKMIDFGELWDQKVGTPIPLGGIVAQRNLSEEVLSKVNSLVYESLKYAYQHPDSSFSFMKKYAQEMQSEVMKAHVDLYVNEFTLSLGEIGTHAIKVFLDKAIENGVINQLPKRIFI